MAVIREICSHVAILNHGVLVEEGSVDEIFNHPKSEAARELILGDIAENQWNGENRQKALVQEAKKIRIVFSENSAFEPVIANMILKFGVPVNILRADTKNVGGIAKGEMILGLPEGEELQQQIEAYLRETGLEIEEVTDYV
jgi:D-methionine transport system ATP-binding protein